MHMVRRILGAYAGVQRVLLGIVEGEEAAGKRGA
jgi:hypothetical protein